MKVIRKVRSFRQRFNPNVGFICRRDILWGDETYRAGEPIPEELAQMKGKLRNAWEAGKIELAEFEQPPGAIPRPEAPADLPDYVEQKGGGWYWVTMPDSGEVKKVRGKTKLDELLATVGG